MKILALSGLEARTSAFSWKDLADDFIPKPFLPAQLVAAVRRLLSTNAIARSPG
jgi:DNA-binding response OmpR family regulator